MKLSLRPAKSQYQPARFVRAVLSVVLVLLAIQLLGVSFHKHAYADAKTDCASCTFAQTLPPALPATHAAAVPALDLVTVLVHSCKFQLFLAQPSYLIPLSQAPPRAAMSA
jgi:hypothetical protein